MQFPTCFGCGTRLDLMRQKWCAACRLAKARQCAIDNPSPPRDYQDRCPCGNRKTRQATTCAACHTATIRTQQEPVVGLTKRCSMCRQTKDHSQFGRAASIADGRQYYCKACAALHRRKKQGRITPDIGAVCPSCTQPRPWADWIRQRGTETGYMEKCRLCVNAHLVRNRSGGRASGPVEPKASLTKRTTTHYARYFATTSAASG